MPTQYRQHLLEYNVITPEPSTFRMPGSERRLQLFSFLGVTEVVNDDIWCMKQLLADSLPDHLIPVATLMNGGFVCLGISGPETGAIYYLGDLGEVGPTSVEGSQGIVQIAADFDGFLELFDQEGDIDQLDEHGLALLHRAAGQGDVEAIETLLAQGADIDVVTADGYSPLFIAASESRAEAVRTLLEAGADTEMTSGRSQATAFQMACAQGGAEIVRLFLEHDGAWRTGPLAV